MTGYLTCETVMAGTSAAAARSPKEIEQREGCVLEIEVSLGFEESSTIEELWLEKTYFKICLYMLHVHLPA